LIEKLRRPFDSYAQILAKRDVRLLFAGLTISATGTWAYRAGLVAYVYGRTHSLTWVGIAVFARLLPQLVMSPYGGLIADKTDKITVLVRANALCAIWQSCLVVIVALDAPVWIALVFVAISGATNCIQAPAVGAAIPVLVDESNLVAANALNATVDNLTIVSGPMVGALLVLVTGSAVVVFAVNAASFVVAGVLAARINTQLPPVEPEDDSDGVWHEVSTGIKSALNDPSARTLVAFSVLVGFISGTDVVLFAGVSADKLGTGVQGYGYLLTGIGLGGVLMAPVVDRLAVRPRLAWIIVIGVAGCCLPTALMVVIHSPGLAVLVQVVRGASALVVDVLAITAMQRAVPKEQVGRVLGVFFAFVIGATTLGSVVMPGISSALGLNAGLLLMAFAPFAIGLGGIPALMSVDNTSAASGLAISPLVPVLQRLELFARATRPLLESLASEAVDREFMAGELIIEQGDDADYLYILLQGNVQVTMAAENDVHPKSIRTMAAPAYFGEIGIIKRIPRTASVTAVGSCTCALISGESLLDALTIASASRSLMATTYSRLALTHPVLASADRSAQEPVGT
jgi:MFS family permease